MEEAVHATLSGDCQGQLLSLKTSFDQADVTAILPWQDKLDDKIIAESILEAVDNATAGSKLSLCITKSSKICLETSKPIS